MMDCHPERAQDSGLEPTVGEELRLGEALRMLERANEDELRQICRLLARQCLVVYPAAVRYLAREAARNLSGDGPWDGEAAMHMATALIASMERPE